MSRWRGIAGVRECEERYCEDVAAVQDAAELLTQDSRRSSAACAA